MAKDSLLSVISFEGNNNTIIHKSEIVNFNTKSQLIVNQSQEALFYKDGIALDLFGPGRHTLTTANLPLIRKFFEKVFGGKTPFPCSVFFINKVSVLDIPWGTENAIPYEDPLYGIFTNIKGYGQFGIRVKDSRKFIVKIVGQLTNFTNQDILNTVRGAVLQTVKNEVANALKQAQVPVLEIPTRLTEISSIIHEKLNEEFDYLGLECTKFYIMNLVADDSDIEELKKAKSAYATKIIEARGLKESRDIQGFDYKTERQFDVLEKAAGNKGAGNVMAPTMGLGMGLGVGKTMADSMQNTYDNMDSTKNKSKCPNCGEEISPNARFCSACGKEIIRKKFCTNCGQEVPVDARFCSSCGNKIE